MADLDTVEAYRAQKTAALDRGGTKVDRPLATRFNRSGRAYAGSYPGVYPMIGSPDDIVEEIQELHRLGLRGAAISFLNYMEELPFFNAEVMPRMVRAGLRRGTCDPAVQTAL
jgi:alkanesulfonate monooxygenase SsuD/methylene tetrahydromethanopterin reductase-like flavin-dependent oxidoreductase (luciferase family)